MLEVIMNDMRVSIKGKVGAPHIDRREIAVNVKLEYDKLPLDKYPITNIKTSEGIGVTLVNGVHECEASLHRYENGSFYIGSATERKRSRDYAKIFIKFLEGTGLIEKGKLVKLEFEGLKVYIDKI